MFTDIDHIGVAVRDLETALALYSNSFGISEWERQTLADRHMAIATALVGSTRLELIAPTSNEAAFAKFLDERGPGMHHIAYKVENIRVALEQVRTRGIRLIDEEPREGLHGTLVAFLHPKSTMGVLIELVEHVVV